MSKEAFPSPHLVAVKGIDFREYVASAALQGILASDAKREMSTSTVAEHAVACADALILALTPKK